MERFLETVDRYGRVMEAEAEQKYLNLLEQQIAEGSYRPDWASLAGAPVPDWFLREKLGIFYTGDFTVCPHAPMNGIPEICTSKECRRMSITGKRMENSGSLVIKTLSRCFARKDFDPASWMQFFKEAGAGYVFPVAEHHDGFQMYESELSHWNAKEMGPKRDLLGELKSAAESCGLQFCTSSHRAEHWFFMGHGRKFDSDVREPMKKGIFTGRQCRNRTRRIFSANPSRVRNFWMTGWRARWS